MAKKTLLPQANRNPGTQRAADAIPAGAQSLNVTMILPPGRIKKTGLHLDMLMEGSFDGVNWRPITSATWDSGPHNDPLIVGDAPPAPGCGLTAADGGYTQVRNTMIITIDDDIQVLVGSQIETTP
jgi:hypothetical protein